MIGPFPRRVFLMNHVTVQPDLERLPTPAVAVVDKKSYSDIEGALKSADPGLPVQVFDDVIKAEAAFSKSLEGGDTLFSVIVTDSIGTKPGAGGVSLIRKFGPRFGLSSVVLYSGDPHRNAQAIDLKKEGLIHHAIDKLHPNNMVKIVLAAHNQLQQDATLRSLREYANTRTTAAEGFFQSGDGRLLSLVDIYREVFHNTPLGQELRLLWEEVQEIEKVNAEQVGTGAMANAGANS